jgi:hypothetical protein
VLSEISGRAGCDKAVLVSSLHKVHQYLVAIWLTGF